MGAKPRPDAENRKERPGAYVPSTVRWAPRTLEKLDALVTVWTERHAKQYTRTSLLNDVIDAMHAAEFGPETLVVPTAPATGPAPSEPGAQPRPKQPAKRKPRK